MTIWGSGQEAGQTGLTDRLLAVSRHQGQINLITWRLLHLDIII